MAYATLNKPDKEFKLSDSHNIDEMAVTVLTSKEAPFQLHMGISRGVEHLLSGKKRTPELAVQLHAFAAQAMKQMDPSKRYFISTPLPKMGDLIVKTLPKDAYQIGENFEGSLIQTAGKWGSSDFKFKLQDKDEKVLFYAPYDDARTKYFWFFNNVSPSSDHPYYVIDLEKLAAQF